LFQSNRSFDVHGSDSTNAYTDVGRSGPGTLWPTSAESPCRSGNIAMTTTIYDVLRESHEIQRVLFRKLLRSRPGSQDRIGLFTEARHELAAHEAAEERYLYVPMMMHDQGLAASRHALHEHHEVDELVEELEALDPAGDAWIQGAKSLSKAVHHHLREEERKFFQVSGKLLSDAQKRRLAGQYRRDYLRMRRNLAAG